MPDHHRLGIFILHPSPALMKHQGLVQMGGADVLVQHVHGRGIFHLSESTGSPGHHRQGTLAPDGAQKVPGGFAKAQNADIGRIIQAAGDGNLFCGDSQKNVDQGPADSGVGKLPGL